MEKIYESNMRSLCRIFFGLLAAAALGMFISFNVAQKNADAIAEAEVNADYFADFSLQTFDGETFSQEDLKQAKFMILNAWNPGCVGCIEEMPDLEELSKTYRDKGILIIGIVADYYQKIQQMDEETYLADIKRTIEGTGVTYPTLLADEAFTRAIFPLTGNSFPCTWAVDPQGKIIDSQSGSLSRKEWIDYFDSLLETAERDGGAL